MGAERGLTLERIVNVQESGGGRKGQLREFAKKRQKVETHADEKASFGYDYEKHNELLRRTIVDTAVGLVEIEESRVAHPSEVNLACVSLLKDKFNIESVQAFKERKNAPNYTQEAVKRSYERLTKSVKLFLNKQGFKDEQLATMTGEQIDANLFESLKGIGEDVKNVLIVDEGLKLTLATVREVVEEMNILDQERAKDIKLRKLEESIRKTEDRLLAEGYKNTDESRSLTGQGELVVNYLTLLKREVDRGEALPDVEDCIVDFISDHILRKDLTLDNHGNLKSVRGDDFDFQRDAQGRILKDAHGNRIYKHPEVVRWLRQREENMEDLIMIVSGGEFSDVKAIDAILYGEREFLLEDYVKDKYNGVRVEGTDVIRGKKSDLMDIKDQLGRWFGEAIQETGEGGVNSLILSTLDANMVEKLLPFNAIGLGVDVVVNIYSDPVLKEVLRRICEIDTKGVFIRMENQNGFSSYERKKALKAEVEAIIENLVNNHGEYRKGDKQYQADVRQLQTWLTKRAKQYGELMEKQFGKIGRYETISKEKTLEGYKQRFDFARKMLYEIKASGSAPGSLDIMEQCGNLSDFLLQDWVEPEIKREIGARFALYFMRHHMHEAAWLVGVRGQSIDDAHENGYKANLLINEERLNFFKDGANGLAVPESWNAIEWVNFKNHYFQTLAEMMGVDVSRLVFKAQDRMTMGVNRTTIKMVESVGNGAFTALTMDSDAGRALIKMKGLGMEFLGLGYNTDGITNEDYLRSWTNEKRYEFLSTYVGGRQTTFNEMQNKRSVLWGKKAGEKAMCWNGFTDTSETRKNMVKKYLLDIIKHANGDGVLSTNLEVVDVVRNLERKGDENKLSLDDGDMELGWEEAGDLMDTLGESVVFNAGIVGHDDFVNLVLTEAGLADQKEKLKVSGMRMLMRRLASTMTTAPRYWAGSDVFGRRGPFDPLYMEDINSRRLREPKSDSYFLYTSLLVKKVAAFYEFFHKENITPKDVLNIEVWKKNRDMMAKIAKYGQEVICENNMAKARNGEEIVYEVKKINGSEEEKQTFRELIKASVRGLLYQSALYPENGWDHGNLLELKRLLTDEFSVSEKDVMGSSNQLSFEEDGRLKPLMESILTKSEADEIFEEETFTKLFGSMITQRWTDAGVSEKDKPLQFQVLGGKR